jgi:hypothetical protein
MSVNLNSVKIVCEGQPNPWSAMLEISRGTEDEKSTTRKPRGGKFEFHSQDFIHVKMMSFRIKLIILASPVSFTFVHG